MNTLTDINIGHFRNSADVEKSTAIVGSPTLMISPGDSMSGDRFSKANPNGVRLGSRTGHNLGAGGKSELLQASPNNLSRELMRDKEEQALKAGAQLIAPSAQITAESARLQRGADTSIAASVANNVSDAYEKAIGHCAEMKGLSDEGVKFQLNTEFFMLQMTAQDRLAWMADINSSIMPVRAYTAAMREAGLTKWTDEQIEEELERQPPPPGLELNTDVVGEIPKAPEEE
ncbi:MAG: DUF4055 domain-containing protein [Alteromonas sp.]|nr:DUF4055 domain-containing protein [Alteromonas sp.]